MFALNIKSALFYKLKLPIADFPKHVKLELTNHCNLSCSFCPNKNQTRARGYMSFKLFKKVVDQCVGNVDMISLHFMGESLMHKDVNKCIDYVKDVGIKAVLSTNATFLKNLKTTPSLTIINYFKKNPLVKEFAKKADKENALYVLQEVGKTRGVHQWGEGGEVFDETHCFDLWSKMAITWDGKVVPCCFFWDAQQVVGDVNKQSIMEAWNSREMQDFRKKHQKGLVKICKYCNKSANWRTALASEWNKEVSFYKNRGGQF